MDNAEHIVRATPDPQPDPHIHHLLACFQQSRPRTFEHVLHYENELGRETKIKRTLCLLMALATLYIYVFLYRTAIHDNVYWISMATCSFILFSCFKMFSNKSHALVGLRQNITRSWVLDAIKNAFPTVREPLRGSDNYATTHARFKNECWIVTSLLQNQADEMAKAFPLALFADAMSDYIQNDKELKRRLGECYQLAEDLNPDSQVHF